MLELIKLITALLTLGDLSKKGIFSWYVMLIGAAVTLLNFAVAAGVISYTDKNPGPTSDRLLLGLLIFVALNLTVTLIWGWRYQKRLAASRIPQPATAA